MRRTIVGVLLVTALIALTTPVLAGGYAVVRLDEEPGEVQVDTPWKIGFMVRQHDITPTNDVTAVVRAQHKETGETITATGVQEGPVGHFVAELTLPLAGEWKWAVYPEPFAETSFETLMVVDEQSSLTTPALHGLPSTIHTGVCAELGDVAYSLGDLNLQEPMVKSTQSPVAVGAATIDAKLTDLLAGEHAVSINSGDSERAPLACGDIAGVSDAAADNPQTEDVVMGLQEWGGSRNVGIAIMRAEGDQTAVTLYLLDADAPAAPVTPSGETLSVKIAGGGNGDWTFAPTSLEIAPGTTVSWVNETDAAHTVTGDDLAFDDSGLIEPGQSFSQTFAEPGIFHYRCAPHPWMEATVIVS